MELPIAPPARHRRRLLIVALLVATVVATAIGVGLTSSTSSATVYAGSLDSENRSDVHEIRLDGATTVTATLEFTTDPPFPGVKQVTASIAILTTTGRQVAGRSGASPVELVAELATGSYSLVVSTRWPLRYRDLNYRLEVTTDEPEPSTGPSSSAVPSPSPGPSSTSPATPSGTTTQPPTPSSSNPPTEPSSTPSTPLPTRPETGNVAAACGTWVLQQVADVEELRRLRPRIEDALALPGVVGLSVRFPWDAADLTGAERTSPLLEAAHEIATDAGKRLSIRFMAGAHTPQRVFDAGASYYLLDNQRVPLPWDNATGSHDVFLEEYREYGERLAAWSRSHGVRLLHLSWYGQDWAELNHGAELREAPGYSEQAWLDGHRDLIDVGVELSSTDLAVELPLSGYGPLSSGESAALAAHIVEQLGPDNDRFFIQANGWDEVREWGSPSTAVEDQFDQIWKQRLVRGLQMIQPDGYDWDQVYDRLAMVGATYGEVYLPSFWQVPGPSAAYGHNTPARIAQLERRIGDFAAAQCG